MAERENDYRPAVNALRGFAALYVLCYHIRYYTELNWLSMFPMLRFGYIGVDFFFILSGLIISHVYLFKSLDAPSAFWAKFVWLRIARLFPVHMSIMLGLLVTALIGPLFDADWQELTKQQWTDWFSLAFLVRQWTLPDGYAWNSPAWSVSAEFFAYLLLFPIVSKIVGAGADLKLGLRMTAFGCCLFMLIILVFGTTNVDHGPGPLLRVTAGFITGTGLFLLLNQQNNRFDWDAILPWTLVSCIPVFFTAALLKANSGTPDLILIIYLALLTCAAYCASGRTAKFLSSKSLFWFGEISFSLYLCHIPVMRILSYSAKFIGLERDLLFAIGCIACSIPVAYLLHRFIEIPARDILRRWPEKSQHGLFRGGQKLPVGQNEF